MAKNMTVSKGERFEDVGGRIWLVRIISYPTLPSGEPAREPDQVVLVAEEDEESKLIPIDRLTSPWWKKV